MSRRIYALLVGIDRYPPPIPRLTGCLNDVDEFESYLEEWGARDGGSPPVVLALRNEQATRDAVIAGFTHHLAKAGQEDVALFYFCGHGSQEPAPEAFWHLEPDRMDETILCYDSRDPGKWDLADKELGKLVDDLAVRAGHVAVILDCCHSGSGTRGELQTVRRAPKDDRIRGLDSFLPGVREAAQAITPRGAAGAGWYAGSRGRHILLAACRDDQTAKEQNGGGRRRGAFSYAIVETLKTLGGSLTYRDLHAQVDALVRSQVDAQTPQIEVVRAEDLDATFLDGTLQPMAPYFIVDHQPGLSTMRAGAAHGIASPTQDGKTLLALFPLTANAEELSDLDNSVGRAEVIGVQAARSQLKVTGLTNPDAPATYKAIVVGLPTPRLVVRLEGDAGGVAAARTALNTAGQGGGPSLYVREAADPGELIGLRLVTRAGRYFIIRPDEGRPLAESISDLSAAGAGLAVRRLEHIARWETARNLRNPASGLGADAVELTILRDGRPFAGTEIRLDYQPQGGNWARPEIMIKLENKTQRTLFCGLLVLSEDFEINAQFFPAGSLRLNKGESAFANDNQPIPLSVPDEFWDQGIIQVRDILKLIVCTEDFDPRLIEQPALAQPRPNELALLSEQDRPARSRTRGRAVRAESALDKLLAQVQTRAMHPGEARALGDWRADDVSFTTVRPRDAVAVPARGTEAPLAQGVTLEGHPSLAGATARLSSITASSRGLGSLALPPLLTDDPTVSFPFTLVTTTTRGDDPGLSVLELEGVDKPEAVTPDAPLLLRVDRGLAAEEHVLPIAFDGEFFLPLGRAEPGPGNTTRIVLERLPGPPPEELPEPLVDQRSVFKSIRIFFQKVLAQSAGFEDPYPILGAVSFDAAGKPAVASDPGRVRALVAKARRILLYIHGILGETRTMVPSAQMAMVAKDGGEAPLEGSYELILSFDYENLNTPIEQTARDLKVRLAAVGLGPGHGKTLHVVAHSMGGLVSRWFIEREGGHEVVQHLVMLGTPNAGSPWPRLQDWATVALGLALNGLTMMAWPTAALEGLLSAVEEIDVALDQMAPGSPFLNTLAASPDPKVPYTLIAGNTSIRPEALQPQPERDGTSVFQRLASKLSPNAALRLVANGVFSAPNDIAVGVASMADLGSGRVPAMEVVAAACDHMSYFHDPAGLAALARALAVGEGTAAAAPATK